jgi:hypothetical protein
MVIDCGVRRSAAKHIILASFAYGTGIWAHFERYAPPDGDPVVESRVLSDAIGLRAVFAASHHAHHDVVRGVIFTLPRLFLEADVVKMLRRGMCGEVLSLLPRLNQLRDIRGEAGQKRVGIS